MPTVCASRFRAFQFLALAAALLAPWLGHAAAAPDTLWSLLKGGGQVVLMRHAITTPGVGDPAGMRLDDCRSQRNLSGEGRSHARRVGAAFGARGIAIERVLASPWCRCMETARLAFGSAEGAPALGNLFGRPENSAAQVRDLRILLERANGPGNLVLVSHGSTIAELTGVYLDTAEMLVVTPQAAGGHVIRGRLSVPPR